MDAAAEAATQLLPRMEARDAELVERVLGELVGGGELAVDHEGSGDLQAMATAPYHQRATGGEVADAAEAAGRALSPPRAQALSRARRRAQRGRPNAVL